MKRVYESILKDHLNNERQMAFVSRPRQVGKTTVAENLTSKNCYINWDNQSHAQIILKGPEQTAETVGLQNLHESLPIIIFGEIHKYSHWKSFLKGFFDTYQK